ncbi:hypothetical protein [Cupriavidus lacunae]|uniref:hypothetical protein n=1 Tax=Cupriavidus lacunae TaxID=2666307 RepID=UPI0010590963|nr:hypothetical protein [Cupriavidus lacunae]
MQYVQKTVAALALASLGCGAWAKAVTFEEIERADTVSGRYINHLSATEMDTVEGSAAPLIVAGAGSVSEHQNKSCWNRHRQRIGNAGQVTPQDLATHSR